ncbi:acetyltransferase [Mycolicibacterium mageritense DSM 44476 = CIP 104973]|uniref:N-acetyltransferase n=1 Tax=Mycolicibacterium mageritense TaxID=53462 RepID=A0AAI8XL71_MYCME|nr:GNAT family N-acetyltransferase [Mycolicibacterium mageritense]OKH77606.1 GNAT family acetyltransferase [Mycobacterium sp. SWH-M3]MCC9181811.1 GNAT family N-acetyltransferase [Mycolicibacterium mageritense]TXI62345.1 MAG: GNAT family N-acetyltransferase [Mycolicibacterium mageritense]CDO21171.1 acetyltransferase [Mycolicibacterium mageritense DSM 44476 = CIP 104973]BBX34308.1 N-acetyltransferase [Mycolicibacterium mageritense]
MPGSTLERLRFQAVGQDDPLAQPLLAELAVEYSGRYGGTAERVMEWLRGHPADEFAPPGGGLLIGLLDGRPVTGGAFQRYDADTAELKRIWTDSGHRRRGYAKRLLVALEAEITARGYRRIFLTTGHRQPEAEALYLSSGYRRLALELPAEGDGTVYPIAFEKALP